MKKLRFLLGFGLITGALMSCAPETIPADADGNADGKYTVNYAVQVVPIGDVSRGLNGASVTIQTQNGVTTKTVGADGIAVFENLNAGTISGYVSAPGYASVNFKATCAAYNVDVNTNGYVSSTVYIPAMNSGIQGRFFADWDQDADNSLTDNGNFEPVDIKVRYNVAGGYPMGSGDGALTQVHLDVNTYGDVADANGEFLFDALPNTDMGYFSATMKIDDVSVLDNATSTYYIVYSYGPVGISLMPGETLQLGDIYIP
jgi:hypothetical protein